MKKIKQLTQEEEFKKYKKRFCYTCGHRGSTHDLCCEGDCFVNRHEPNKSECNCRVFLDNDFFSDIVEMREKELTKQQKRKKENK